MSAPSKFWTIVQNNSGGIFDHDAEKGIGYGLCVEAVDQDHASGKLQRLVESYPASYDCSCCGDRWSIYFFGDDGTDEPELYGRPLEGGWGIPSYVHYLDGRIEPRTDAVSA